MSLSISVDPDLVEGGLERAIEPQNTPDRFFFHRFVLCMSSARRIKRCFVGCWRRISFQCSKGLEHLVLVIAYLTRLPLRIRLREIIIECFDMHVAFSSAFVRSLRVAEVTFRIGRFGRSCLG
jgi:hypothetical protein